MQFVFNKYYDPGMYAQEQWFDRTHNIFFDWLIAGGVLALATYLSFFGLALYYIWRRNRGFFNFSVAEKALLTGLLAGYFFHNIFVFDNLVSYMLFATLLAFLARTGNEHTKVVGGDREVSADIINTVWIPTVVVVMCVVLWVGSVRPYVAGQTLINAIRPQQLGVATNLESFKKALDIGFARPEIREQLMQVALSIQGANVDLKYKKEFLICRAEFEKQLKTLERCAIRAVLRHLLNRLRAYDELLCKARA